MTGIFVGLAVLGIFVGLAVTGLFVGLVEGEIGDFVLHEAVSKTGDPVGDGDGNAVGDGDGNAVGNGDGDAVGNARWPTFRTRSFLVSAM